MIITGWRGRLGHLLLILGLVAGPWPAALAATASAGDRTAAIQQLVDEAPCPMDEPTVVPPCHCCDDGVPCSALQCVISTPAPGLPVGAIALATVNDGVIDDADLIPRPPEPHPGERLRPPIA